MTYNALWHRLTPFYSDGEAKAIVRWVLQQTFGLSLADVLCGKVNELSAEQVDFLEEIMLRLETGEPMQYVVGYEEFCGLTFKTDRRALIPRPETEELCRLIIASRNEGGLSQEKFSVLDICTGTGCIAVTLAKEWADAQVTAWDLSDDALSLAQENAHRCGVAVDFERKDALHIETEQRQWDLIVSNPPYVCESEKQAMAVNVLQYEPAMALFVPDDDPLRFYRAIGQFAADCLKPHGMLWFEINKAYGGEVCALLEKLHFIDVEMMNDSFGNVRFVKAMHP